MRRFSLIVFCGLIAIATFAADYHARVVDSLHHPILYASVYLRDNPVEGTATNTDGAFSLSTAADPSSILMISCVGYELLQFPLSAIPDEIVMHEQPINLEETVVRAKKTKKSKRKLLAQVLHDTYQQLLHTLPQHPVAYDLVSDVKMDASLPSGNATSWGMEQMIATAIEQPSTDLTRSDSLQFIGRHCKRYCNAQVRERVDSLLVHEDDPKRRKMALAIDSGTIVHRALWHMNLDKAHLLDVSDELSRWKLTAESNSQVLLTYTRKHNFLGMFKATIVENLVVDSYDFTLQTYTVDIQASIFLPFSIRLSGTELEWVNLLNMNNQSLEKFRLKRGNMHARISTLYTMQNGVLVPTEKNMHTTGQLEDRKGNVLPCDVSASQHVTQVTTSGVQLRKHYNKSHRVPRTIVPIY